MSLTHCIIHHISRTSPGAPLNTRERENRNELIGPTSSLFEQLKRQYQGRSLKQYGHFDSEQSDNPIPAWLQEYVEQKSSFESISKRITSHLCAQLQNIEDPLSAHLMFAVEQILGQDRFYLFWIEHEESWYINGDLEVDVLDRIDGSKLHYVARISFTEWLDESSPKYLSLLVPRGNKEISEAFIKTLGFSEGLDVVTETQEFLGIVDEFAGNLPEPEVAEYRSKLMDYCVEQDKLGEPVVISDISQQLNEDEPEQFANFVSERQASPRDELHTDRASLKRYIRFFGRDRHMSISFDSSLFGDAVEYDANNERLIISKLPKSLKQQLSKHRE